MKNNIIILFLGAIVYLMITRLPHTGDVLEAQSTPSIVLPSPSPSPVPDPAPFVASIPPPLTEKELVMVRGEVEAIIPDGLIVSCYGKHSAGANWRLHPNAGAGDTARMAELANRVEEREYGPVLERQNNAMRPTGFYPGRAAVGGILLHGYPNVDKVPGERFRVVAAPTGDIYKYTSEDGKAYDLEVYTVDYELSELAKRERMWENSALRQPSRR